MGRETPRGLPRQRPGGVWPVVILVLGCQRSALKQVEAMRDMACRGDATGFFESVDKEALVERLIAAADRGAQKAVEQVDIETREATLQAYRKTAEVQQRAVGESAFAEWQKDIIEGQENGDLCTMTILDSTGNDSTAEVRVRTPSGKNKTWSFALSGKRWRLVGLASGHDIAVTHENVGANAAAVVDRDSVDAIVDRLVHGTKLLRQASGGPADMQAQYEMALADFRTASQQLFPKPPAGVPDAVGRTASAKFDASAAAFKAQLECSARSGGRTGACVAVARQVHESAVEAGKAIAMLAAYGSRPIDEVQGMFGAGAKSTSESPARD